MPQGSQAVIITIHMISLPAIVTFFISNLVEVLPFLLVGTVIAGMIDVFVTEDGLKNLIPNNRNLVLWAGILFGLALPAGKYGIIPIALKLHQRGVPIPAIITFLCSAPVINPIALVSTYAVYGFNRILIAQFTAGVCVAYVAGLIFSTAQSISIGVQSETLNFTEAEEINQYRKYTLSTFSQNFHKVSGISADDFIAMGTHLITGCLIAAIIQIIFPLKMLLTSTLSPISNVFTMQILAFVFSSDVISNASIGLTYSSLLGTGNYLGFLLLGNIVDIKNFVLYTRLFSIKTTIYVLTIVLLLTTLVEVFITLNVRL